MIDNEYSGKLFIPSREYERIESLVVDLYEEVGVTEVPIDAFAIARKKNYLLKPFTQLKNMAIRRVYGLSADGFSLYDPEKQCFVIFYDNLQCKERQRFTIMHEIGHILLGHKDESDLANQMANYFAGYSLAPYPIMDLYRIEDCIQLAKFFGVSRDCAQLCTKRYEKWKLRRANPSYEQKLLSIIG